MAVVRSYRDLQVWQKAMDVVDEVYRITGAFPGEERFGLSGQLQRAAVSVPANTAEGHATGYTKQYLRHLSIALGSLAEVETLLVIGRRRSYMAEAKLQALLELAAEVGRMLRGIQKSLKRKLRPQPQAPNPKSLTPSP